MTRIEFMKLTKAQRIDIIAHINALRKYGIEIGENELAFADKSPMPDGCHVGASRYIQTDGKIRTDKIHGLKDGTVRGFTLRMHTAGERKIYGTQMTAEQKERFYFARTLFTRRRNGE